MAAKTISRPYKLEAKGDHLTRDDLATWKQVLLGHIRQNPRWLQFLPTSETHSTWKSTDEDELNGFDEATNAETATLHANFLDFIGCVANFAPTGSGGTILREATSFNWVIEDIENTHNLKSKGESFLEIEDLKLDYDVLTHQQGFAEIKDFVCAGLIKKGQFINGKITPANERLTFAVKNFITKEWLNSIDKRLPKYVKEMKGYLFTIERPSLACNQRILCDQIPAMLADLDKTDNTNHGHVNMGYVPHLRGGRGLGGGRHMQRRNFLSRVPFRGAPARAPLPAAGRLSQTGCFRCLEATPARYDAARTHLVKECPWPAQQRPARQPPTQPNFRVVLFPEDNQVQQPTPTHPLVSMGQLGLSDDPYYAGAVDQNYYQDYYYNQSQYYQPQEEYGQYGATSISELPPQDL